MCAGWTRMVALESCRFLALHPASPCGRGWRLRLLGSSGCYSVCHRFVLAIPQALLKSIYIGRPRYPLTSAIDRSGFGQAGQSLQSH
ncbi:hypothetical protein BDV32DRAFT_122263 [Aspergillus pseudonomiae]|nr:hypothetical protein BDV32DRAFT_122263 [Aspergillus pseudonomiae]